MRGVRRAAIAFDIDGVLLRGSQALPCAKRALQRVEEHSIPHVFLTNGGGMMEEAKAEQLRGRIGVRSIHRDQIVLCHTPLQSLVPSLKDKMILVIGNMQVCAAAKSYGFNHVVNVAQLIRQNPTMWPWPDSLYHQSATPFEGIAAPFEGHVTPEDIEAVFVMYDGLCWGAEIQAICDVLRPPRDKSVPLYFTNDDVTYSAAHHHPRIAGGVFRLSANAVYESVYGKPLEFKMLGKPFAPTYDFTEESLGHPQRVFAVGDNPKSDIRGANSRPHWTSILVRTGVFPPHLENDPLDPADVVVQDVEEAVEHVIEEIME